MEKTQGLLSFPVQRLMGFPVQGLVEFCAQGLVGFGGKLRDWWVFLHQAHELV